MKPIRWPRNTKAFRWLREPVWPVPRRRKPVRYGSKGDSGGNGDGVGAVVLKSVGAVAAGIGVTGAVVVVGAAVLWFRFKGAGLPATQAVSVQPKYEPLVQGAQTTIVFVLIALAVVLLMFFADPKGNIRGITLVTLLALALGATIYAAGTDLSCPTKVLLAVLAFVLAAGSVAVGRRAVDQFWPFAIAVFVAALVFSSCVGLLITKQQKFVQAVAVLRSSTDAGLTGIYVTATEKKIYVGMRTPIQTPEGSVRRRASMFDVDRGPGVAYAVGPLESGADAAKRARVMLAKLIANRGLDKGAASLPEKGIDADVVGAFAGKIALSREVGGEGLCLARYAEVGGTRASGHWWTSCEEAEQVRTVQRAKERFALPARFQAVYDARVEMRIPAGADVTFLEGKVAPQCEHAAPAPCGFEYAGGGIQYYVLDPDDLAPGGMSELCTTARQNRPSRWHRCLP